MANTIILKKSSTVGKVPGSGDLQIGELAVNLADQKLYSKNASGTVILVGTGGGGSGDVVGPASATDNAITRYDGTTGKLIQNSTVTLDDNGNVTGVLSEQWDITNTPPAIVAGLEAWDDGNGTLELGLKGGNVSYKYGQQEFVRAYNGSGFGMSKGQVVYIVGAQGNRVDIRLALADSDATSAGTIGIVAESIANGDEGFVQVSGTMPKLNTNGLTAGAPIYLSPATPGVYTTTKPTAPDHTVYLGWIERVSSTVGSIYIKVDNGYELNELHNVLITSPASGDTLIYNATTGVWVNNDLTASTGISVTNGAGTITITNTAPDQTVSLTGAGTTTITGTYPNFTITSNDQYQGTVTAVTGTAPVTSSGGNTPAIGLASGYGDTQNPYASKTANYVLAAPNGSAGVPTFRAIVAADIPTLNQNTTGTASNVTGTVAIANGGTGQTTRQDAMDALAGAVTSGYYLRGNGTDVVMSAIQASDVPTLNQNTTGTAAGLSATLAVSSGGTGQATYTDGQLLIGNSTGNTLTKATLTAGTGISITNGNGSISIAATSSGGVTSVTGTSPVVSSGGTTPAISLASGYGDTQNPYASKTANYVLAAPNGTAGVPTFRAIVAADIPTLNQNTTGTAAGLSATLAIGSGGTGQTSFTANYIHYGSFSTSANLTYNGTDFTCGGNVTAYSDERVKTNWRELPADFIDRLVNVKHGIYDRIDNGITQVGVGAQSLMPVLGQAVIEEDGRLSVAYGNAALVAVIELSKRVLELEKRLKDKGD